MLEMDTLTWEEPLSHRMKVERNLNFATLPNDEDDFGFSRKKTARDPMSHRIIEKRRRDRMNNCLADLSRLVPTNYLKKGRGRIEKTEIIEMAIKHLKHLQAHPCKDPGSCEVAKATEQDHKRQYRMGYQECMSETVRFMVESEGLFSGDGVCVRLMNHLQKHYDKVAGGLCYTQALNMMVTEESKSSMQMDVENHSSSCFASESNTNGVLHAENTHFSFENNRSSDAPEVKHESESNSLSAPVHHEAPAVKVTSQLREMLQNPGVPKDSLRCSSMNGSSSLNSTVPSPVHHPITVVVPSPSASEATKADDVCYKFKNNIKHRFHADVRHHTSSPTDSHLSDRMSLPDEDNNNNKIHLSDSSPLRSCHQSNGDDRLVPNGPPVLLCNNSSHAFSPYPVSHAASEVSIKIPERTVPSENGTYGGQHWDSHETASSCGSNPSPPPNTARSNGSSSGYSTNSDNNSVSTKLKSHNGIHSPTLSPYSRTPDRLSNRSPSPVPPGVPIFALHPKGTFYIPLTVESSLLIPYMVGIDDLAPVLHPISICVNLSSHSVKVEKVGANSLIQYRSQQSSFLMEKFHDRLIYPERHMFYPCPNSPARNGCT